MRVVGCCADDDDDGNGGGSVEAATKRLLAQLARKNTVDNVVPVLIALKRQLGESHEGSGFAALLWDCRGTIRFL